MIFGLQHHNLNGFATSSLLTLSPKGFQTQKTSPLGAVRRTLNGDPCSLLGVIGVGSLLVTLDLLYDLCGGPKAVIPKSKICIIVAGGEALGTARNPLEFRGLRVYGQ